jgi:hypothetical protein
MKWQESILCKLMLKKYILCFTLSIGMLLYQEGYYMNCLKVSMLTKPKTPSEMSETYWPHTLHLSPNPGKTVCSGFQTGVSGLAYNGYISKTRCFNSKTGCFGFYWLVSNG